VTHSVMSGSLSLQSSRSMFGVLLVDRGVGYEYVHAYNVIMFIVFAYL
jgi:hypothetical protein